MLPCISRMGDTTPKDTTSLHCEKAENMLDKLKTKSSRRNPPSSELRYISVLNLNKWQIQGSNAFQSHWRKAFWNPFSRNISSVKKEEKDFIAWFITFVLPRYLSPARLFKPHEISGVLKLYRDVGCLQKKVKTFFANRSLMGTNYFFPYSFWGWSSVGLYGPGWHPCLENFLKFCFMQTHMWRHLNQNEVKISWARHLE